MACFHAVYRLTDDTFGGHVSILRMIMNGSIGDLNDACIVAGRWFALAVYEFGRPGQWLGQGTCRSRRC